MKSQSDQLTEKVRLKRDQEVVYPAYIIPKGARGEIVRKGEYWTVDFEEHGRASLHPEKFEKITELEIKVEEEYQRNFHEKIRDFLKL